MHSVGGKTGEQQTGNEWALCLGSAASALHFPPGSPVLAVPGCTGRLLGESSEHFLFHLLFLKEDTTQSVGEEGF